MLRCFWRRLILSVSFGLTVFSGFAVGAPFERAHGINGCAAMVDVMLDQVRWISAKSKVVNGPSLKAVELTPRSVCQLTLEASPVTDSAIGIEVWLPESGWNGKLQMVGNGGYSARIDYDAFRTLIGRGYAVVGTDTGHQGDDPSFALGRPEAIKDWSFRAVHVSVVHAKRLIQTFYGKPARHSYFSGCSTGGHQGLMAAQRYPHDFDGIIVGAPGHNRTHLNAGFLWQFVQNRDPEDSSKALLSPDDLKLVSGSVLERCRDNNGTVSGGLRQDVFLNNPYHCDFDPQMLACARNQGNDAHCLSTNEVQALKRMYAGAHNPRTGKRIYFGFLPGTEAAGGYADKVGWSLYWADPKDSSKPARASFWQHWAFPGEPWHWQDFDFDRDMKRADDRLANVVNAMSSDLTDFFHSGGKLLHFHGLNDPVVPATDSISYHNRVVDAFKPTASLDLEDSYRLYLMPGVNHCGGGPGPGHVDFQTVMERWVERGLPPGRVVASSPGVESSPYERPLCPYPTFAYYDGKGAPEKAQSFECRRPERKFQVPQVSTGYLR